MARTQLDHTCGPMRHGSFAVFIVTHKRPDKQHTLQALRKQGYTGDIYLIVDDSDPTLDQYLAQYGKQVIIYSKREAHESLGIDVGLPSQRYKSVVYSRSIVWRFAHELNLDYFVVLDDDYTDFLWYMDNRLRPLVRHQKVRCLNALFDIAVDFIQAARPLHFAFSKTSNYFGGAKSGLLENVQLLRRTMNVFFQRADTPHRFYGYISEDSNTYISLGHRGGLTFTSPFVAISTIAPLKQAGGLTEIYNATGAYARNFIQLLYCPSCVRLSITDHGGTPRVKCHAITKQTWPVILHERYRKSASPYKHSDVHVDDLPAEYMAYLDTNQAGHQASHQADHQADQTRSD